ncbi:glycosyltransferase family 4 protein [bacterium]|nr:glycosyltransferase family 4 protein [bacterium]
MTTLAIAFDYVQPVYLPKEGGFIYLKYLLEALLSNYPDFKCRFYTYKVNENSLKEFFLDILTTYPKRVSIFCAEDEITGEAKIKIFLAKIKYFFTRKRKFLVKIVGLKKNYRTHGYYGLRKQARKSHVNAVFVVHTALELGHFFRAKKIVQIHDLFTIPLENLWKEQYPNIGEENLKVLNNLKRYAKEKTFFVSSTDYIAQNQVYKYVDSVKQSQIKVIPFPPFVKSFSNENILGEAEFRAKYGIYGKYIPYPSQNRVNKNVIVLLKALKTLRDKGTEIKFVTTGHIYGLANTASYIKENNLEDLIVKLEYLPESDLAALYKYGTVAVVPTIIEGLGMSGQCLEALSAGGIPVVHAKSMGIKESLESVHLSMETADLNWFELDDYEGLARTIEEVISNPQQHIEKQKHILSAYLKRTWQEVANDYMEIIK